MPLFKYGKKGGILAVVLLVLAVVPILTAVIFIPQMPDTVPMKISAAGEVLREGPRYELLVLPVLCLCLEVATLSSAFKQASNQADSALMSRLTFERYVRNGVVTGIVLNAANIYLFAMVLTGKGLGF